MAVTDDERREVARKLRSFVTDDSVYADVDACHVLYSIGLYYKDIDRIYFSGFDVARLADLIEPSIPADPGEAGLACVDAFIREHTEKQVDRDALLALADNLDSSASMLLKQNDLDSNRKRRGMRRDHAQSLMAASGRIREALGVSE